jgi:hypothetical protein
MLSCLGKKMISRNMAKAREGDIGPTLKIDEAKAFFGAWGRRFSVWVGVAVEHLRRPAKVSVGRSGAPAC